MNYLKIKESLNLPYPFYESQKQALKICISVGIFIASFCYLFEPFEMQYFTAWEKTGYGIVAFLASSFHALFLPLIFPMYLRNEGWTIWKEFTWVILIMMSISTASYIYSGFIMFGTYGFEIWSFLGIIFKTVVVGIIPTFSILLYKQMYAYKMIIHQVKQIDSRIIEKSKTPFHASFLKVLTLESDNKKDTIKIPNHKLLFIESSGNYVEIHYLNDVSRKKKLMRNNITQIIRQVGNSEDIIRCHRSFIVNLKNVDSIKGNLQGYKLRFIDIEDEVLVSRSYTKRVKEYFLK